MPINRRTALAGGLSTLGALGTLHPGLALARNAQAKSQHFPAGFAWGAATAAYQVEGNNLNSDTWALEHAQPTTFAEPSGDAANSFELWPRDLDLVRSLGFNTYRFSLEWARIEPARGQFSQAMLDHYKAMVEGCHERGLTPVVTFNHFTTPIWFAANGGWSSAEAVDLFANFCERAARHLADGLSSVTTLNEPNLVGMLEVALPGGRGAKLIGPDKAMSEAVARKLGAALFLAGNPIYVPDRHVVQANLIAGHKAGRAAIKAVRSDLKVGVSLAINDDQAVPGGEALRDSMRAQLYDPWLEAAREDDFLGVQNYYRAVWGPEGKLANPSDAIVNSSGSEIYAASLAGAVRYAHSRCPLPVTGYLHWSLLDNYEWFHGYAPKYGLCSVDRTSFARHPKPSAHVLGRIAANNAL
ncbi:glycoside hydrolase family 1 protein [Novosphingobium sp. YJ-S2-02]|uniref:Glycoside hydrolase family 1 protein n=1 Tax=Novosphingobium aureum TaxID=2792964 RepID=A0A931HE16_9SPHN|nr:family 1 glycosylhydrolase [Novosphingobium aureum]MBH0114405.1 glycoside hydrolase family 1 protein [Novosphingobium aureum]